VPASRHAALVHSPLTTATAWGEVPARLRERGWTVTVTEVWDDDPPYLARFVAHTAQQLQLAAAHEQVVLVGFGAAGPLLPQIAFARQAAGYPVGGYVFVDALLPRTLRPGNLLDVMESSDPAAAAVLAQHLSAGGLFPDLSEPDLADTVPDPADRALLLASFRPRRLDFFTEPLPTPVDWPDAPCAYVRLSETHGPEARTATSRDWRVRVVDGAHRYWAITHPDETAAVLSEVASF
jgi:hypothetical protein